MTWQPPDLISRGPLGRLLRTAPHGCRLALALCALSPAGLAASQPDYGQSTLTGPATARERDVIGYTLSVRNTGDAPSAYLAVKITLPVYALRAASDPDLELDLEAHALRGTLQLAPGQERAFDFSVIAAPDSAGNIVAPMAEVQAVPGGTVLHARTEIESRRAADELVGLLGLQFTRAGLWVLGYLALCPALVGVVFALALLQRDRSAPRPLPAAALLRGSVLAIVSLGFLLIFADLAREDLRIAREFSEASCEIVDLGGKPTVSEGGGGSKRSVTWSPVVAVRFELQGRTQYASGFDSPTRLRIGGGQALRDELESLVIGARRTCWYDPLDPARMVVRRGPGGAYAFAALPLGLLALAGAILRHALRDAGRRRPRA